MGFKIVPSHVSILVPSARKAAEYLKQFGFNIEKEDVFESEGTREIYVEKDKLNSLLLMEAINPGAYQRALEKRGPGLHHLAIDVLDIEKYIDSLSGTGWLLHPISVKWIKQIKTAYLARPGFPGLIEVQQKERLEDGSLFVDKIFLPLDSKLNSLLTPVGLGEIVEPSNNFALSLNGRVIDFINLL